MRTVQGALEEAVSTVLREKITTIGAGRTDAGVHAYSQVVNFRTESNENLKKLQWSINCLLPKDISIRQAALAPELFNARRDAISREYIYQILNRSYRSAFLGEISLFYPWKLSLKAMERASKHFVSTHDFRSFCHYEKEITGETVRTIQNIGISRQDDLITINIRANSFLHNMVRIIVGTMLEVGAGKRSPDDIPHIIEARDRSIAGETVQPHGLILKAVYYPAEIENVVNVEI
jgi:tRNA pseudouridine38-40 synthase